MIANYAEPFARCNSGLNDCRLIALQQFLAFWIVSHIGRVLHDFFVWMVDATLISQKGYLQNGVVFEELLFKVAYVQKAVGAHPDAVIDATIATGLKDCLRG